MTHNMILIAHKNVHSKHFMQDVLQLISCSLCVIVHGTVCAVGCGKELTRLGNYECERVNNILIKQIFFEIDMFLGSYKNYYNCKFFWCQEGIDYKA